MKKRYEDRLLSPEYLMWVKAITRLQLSEAKMYMRKAGALELQDVQKARAHLKRCAAHLLEKKILEQKIHEDIRRCGLEDIVYEAAK